MGKGLRKEKDRLKKENNGKKPLLANAHTRPQKKIGNFAQKRKSLKRNRQHGKNESKRKTKHRFGRSTRNRKMCDGKLTKSGRCRIKRGRQANITGRRTRRFNNRNRTKCSKNPNRKGGQMCIQESKFKDRQHKLGGRINTGPVQNHPFSVTSVTTYCDVLRPALKISFFYRSAKTDSGNKFTNCPSSD